MIEAEIIKMAAGYTAAGFALAVPGIAGVTAYHHRELTHRSIRLAPPIQRFIKWEMGVYSPQAPIWAAVHRDHHKQPDISRKSALDIYRLAEWVEANPEKAHVTVPDSFPHIARGVERFSLEDVKFVGSEAERHVIERKGESYQRPSDYTKEEQERIFYPTADFAYPNDPEKEDYTQDEEETIMLTDPHAPILTGKENPVREVLKGNVRLYRRASHLYRKHPELMPKDLQTGEIVDHQGTRIRGFIVGSLTAAAIVAIAHGLDYGALDALRDGVILNTIKLGFHIAGGSLTNSLGHAAKMTSRRFVEAIFGKKYELQYNSDGTAATDAADGGILSSGIGILTFDEAIRQKEHHDDPSRIAYTSAKGLRAWFEAPWGMALDTMARSKYFPFINVGEGFPGVEFEDRPDMPSSGVRLIQNRIREQNYPTPQVV